MDRMMTRLLFVIQRRRRDERGQAMPMAAVGLFAMVLGVLATLNLGQAVHEKIRLQNTADAAAYSLAAMEARTFNYIAFLNRVQIAHYNTAMVVQSYMTWVGFHLAHYGTTVDLLSTLHNAVQRGMQMFPHTYPVCVVHCGYVMLNNLMQAIVPGIVQIRDRLIQLREFVDKLGHWIVQAMSIFNDHAVWQTQFSRAVILNGHILTGMQSYIGAMDPDISFTSGRSALLNMFVNAALNSIEYYQTFDNASGVNPFIYGVMQDMQRVGPGGAYRSPQNLDEPAKEAYRLMTELCHATRTPQFVSNRQGGINPIMLPGAGMWNPILTGSKLGQTKFTEEDELSGAEVTAIGSEGNYEVGKTISSDDFMRQGTGFAMANALAAIATVNYTGNNKLGDAVAGYEEGFKHYLYTGPDSTSNNTISPDGSGVIAYPPPGGQASSEEEETHSRTEYGNWPGYAPFFKFKPNSDRTRDYNQPSTWIFLNKHHRDFQTADGSHAPETRAPWYSNFSWTNGGDVARLNTAIGGSRNSYLFEGLNVLSRGMAYYHRPGHWKEHPNFFNPYWRARLAPVGQKLQNFWDRYVTSNITSDSDSAVIRGMVNFLRNAQMDLFTAAITSLITH